MKKRKCTRGKWITEVRVTGTSEVVHASALEMLDDHLRHDVIATWDESRAHDKKVWRLKLERLEVKA